MKMVLLGFLTPGTLNVPCWGLGDMYAKEPLLARTWPCLSDESQHAASDNPLPPRPHTSERDAIHGRRHQPASPVCEEQIQQGPLAWKILSHRQKALALVTLVLPYKSLRGQHNGKRKSQPRKPPWGELLTPTTGRKVIALHQSGSGILSSRLLNWIQLPGKVILLSGN